MTITFTTQGPATVDLLATGTANVNQPTGNNPITCALRFVIVSGTATVTDGESLYSVPKGNPSVSVTALTRVSLPSGTHKIDVQHRATSGTCDWAAGSVRVLATVR